MQALQPVPCILQADSQGQHGSNVMHVSHSRHQNKSEQRILLENHLLVPLAEQVHLLLVFD